MTVTVGNAVTLNASDKTYELDDRIVVYRDGGIGTDTLFTYDKDGKLIAGPVDMPVTIRDNDFWHMRDDGDGGFTLYHIKSTQDRTGVTTSYDTDLNVIDTGTYEQGEGQGSTGNFTFPITNWEQLKDAVDLPDGGIIGIVTNADGSGDSVVTLTPDGKIEDESPLSFDSLNSIGAHAITRSGEKALVVARGSRIDADNAQEIYGIIMNSNGTIAKEEFKITEGDNQSSGFGTELFVVDTTFDGRFVIAWVSEKDGVSEDGDNDIWYKVLDADGSVAVRETKVNEAQTKPLEEFPRIHTFEDGSFAITFDTQISDDFAPRTRGAIQVFDADGEKVGSNELLGREVSARESTILDNGEGLIGMSAAFAAATEDPNSAYPIDIEIGDPITNVNTGEIPDPGDTGGGNPGDDDDDRPEITGSKPTNRDDVLEGTNGRDKINLKKGDDLYRGLGGKDKINGSKGNDTIDGGAGNDKINGGSGSDNLNGGEGKDKITAGKGDDVILGGRAKTPSSSPRARSSGPTPSVILKRTKTASICRRRVSRSSMSPTMAPTPISISAKARSFSG
ncbi:MAG: hypothetical protein AAFQ36_08695 [Pseudomonadota bacterium]